MNETTPAVINDIKKLTIEMNERIRNSFGLNGGIKALALIVGVVTPSRFAKYVRILNPDGIALEDIVTDESRQCINNIGAKRFIASLLSDKELLQKLFLSNDSRYCDYFCQTSSTSCSMSECDYIVNPPIGTERLKRQRMHYCTNEDDFAILEWAIQCMFLYSLNDKTRYCSFGNVPKRFFRGKAIYFSRFFTKADNHVKSEMNKWVESDKNFVMKALKFHKIGKTSLTAFLPEEMNYSPSTEKLRTDLISNAFIRSAVTYDYNDQKYVAWNLVKTQFQNLEDRDRTTLILLKGFGWLLIIAAIILFSIGSMYPGIISTVAAIMTLPINIYLRRKSKTTRKPLYLGLCYIKGTPTKDDAKKIKQKILRLEEDAAMKNNEHLSRGDATAVITQESDELKSGHSILTDKCEVSFYTSSIDVRPSFKAFLHQPDMKMGHLGDLVVWLHPQIAIKNDSNLPLIDRLSENYVECNASEHIVNTQNDNRNAYVIQERTILFDHKKGKVGYVDIEDGCKIPKDKIDESIVLFRITKDAESKMRLKYLLKMLTSDFVKEQLLRCHNDEIRNVEIPIPDLIYQDSALALDKHMEYMVLIKRHKHDIGNRLPIINNAFSLLKLAMDNNGGTLYRDQIANEETGATVWGLMEQISETLDKIGWLMHKFWDEEDNTHNEVLKLNENVEKFIREQCHKTYSIEYQNNLPNREVNVKMSADDLSSILRNVFINVEKHGFTSKERTNYTVKVNLSLDLEENFATIKISNNGNRLPAEYSSGLVMKDGVGEGDSEHVGLGSIEKICKKHKGTFEFKDEDSTDGFCISNNIKLVISK